MQRSCLVDARVQEVGLDKPGVATTKHGANRKDAWSLWDGEMVEIMRVAFMVEETHARRGLTHELGAHADAPLSHVTLFAGCGPWEQI